MASVPHSLTLKSAQNLLHNRQNNSFCMSKASEMFVFFHNTDRAQIIFSFQMTLT
jgi:hypothetical protein